ncbi:MAG: BrnT family toxin [Candidatus Bipolaricaulia bacterium]
MQITVLDIPDHIADHIVRHGVVPDEVEEVFFEDVPYFCHAREGRYYAYGQTGAGRYLVVIFEMVGNQRAQAVSAWDMKQSERRMYLKKRKR